MDTIGIPMGLKTDALMNGLGLTNILHGADYNRAWEKLNQALNDAYELGMIRGEESTKK
jgi:uncharacterized lipoprotein